MRERRRQGGIRGALTWARQLGSLALGCGALALGCSTPGRQLHALSGDDFGVFPPGDGRPQPVACTGTLDARFACFSAELERRAQELDVAAALALAKPDGSVRSVVLTDTLNASTRLTNDTRFAAASISKMFLAAAVLSLKEQGALDLQRPIASYLPELGSDAGVGRATLHQLLSHTSGLASPEQCAHAEDDLPALLHDRAAQRLLAPPGAVFNYSNLGYSFVALVLERVTGQRFEDVVRERVLSPAGLTTAGYDLGQLGLSGHGPSTIPPRCRAMWPPGGLVLSVRELGRWASELAHPETSRLGRPLIEQLTGAYVLTGERPGAAYGYGVKRFDHDGVTIFSHGGKLEDASALVAWSPDRQIGVAAFANTSTPSVMPAGFRALATFLSLSPDWSPPAAPTHALSAYTGTYVDEVGTLGRVRVSLEGEALALDYLDARPPLLPAVFSFRFEPGAAHPRYVVTPVGVAERRGD